MLKRPFKSLIARIAIIALALSLVVPFVPAAFAQSTPPTAIPYAENGTDPVGTFYATDEDGEAVTWGLGGDDAEDFEISTAGVLTFKENPNYEIPNDLDTDNVYKITLTATEGSTGTLDVEVTVSDVDEAGKVTLDQPQPQVGRNLGVGEGLDDPDGGETDHKWQWSRSPNVDGPWTDIAGATTTVRTPDSDDLGMYLRATVTYTDKFGTGKIVSAVSETVVESRTVANAAPSFADHDTTPDDPTDVQAVRDVDEGKKGANVGQALGASDGDNDVLIYTIDTDSQAMFTIDSRTGQLKTKVELNSDDSGTTSPDDVDGETTHTVIVTATDPSSATGMATVTVTVNDVNDSPVFPDTDANTKTQTIAENITELTVGEPYAATDADETDADDSLTYEVTGADADFFTIGNGVVDQAARGQLALKESPNFEKKSSYSITITATDDGRGTAEIEVTVNVTNAEDMGTVGLSQREPQVGRAVVASLSDEDGGTSGVEWQWYRNATAGTVEGDLGVNPCVTNSNDLCRIPTATSPSYVPVAADAAIVENDGLTWLAVQVTYTDEYAPEGGTGDTAFARTQAGVQISKADNTAPKFADDQDSNTAGDQADAVRSVAENAKEVNVGDAVTATDADNSELMIYSLSGADADSFTIESGLKDSASQGQIKTKVELDYETKDTYTVIVTAIDPSGAIDTINVIINVTNEDDKPVITGDKTLDYAENGTEPVATFSATDEEGDAITWGLEGDDAADFEISTAGVLTFKDSPNFEDAQDDDTDNVYKVTVTATGDTKGIQEVEVTVSDVDEAGKVALDQPQPQVGRNLGVGEGLDDPDTGETDHKWQWSRSPNVDGPWTDIAGATTTVRTPDSDDLGMYLRATVTYTDKFGTGKIVSAVSENVVESKTVANAAPSFADHDTTPDDPTDVQAVRDVDEGKKGANVGQALGASDGDNDVLIYTIDTDSQANFTIDSRTGQLKTKVELVSDNDGNDDVDDSPLMVIVTATDPSSATGMATVTVTVNDVNDNPVFPDTDANTKTQMIAENTVTLTVGDAYAATDADMGDGDDVTDAELTYGVTGADAEFFTIGNEEDDRGQLSLKEAANFEEKSSYSITITATDDGRGTAEIEVTVTVTNAEDPGSVGLSQREPQVGLALAASLSDEDGGTSGVEWEWYRNAEENTGESALEGANACADDDDATLCRIPTATSPSYIPVAADAATDEDDVLTWLAARVTYTDEYAPEGDTAFATTQASVQISKADNTAPKFADDQDPTTAGEQADAVRSVVENAKEVNVGDAVTATDANGDKMIYSLSGADADSFTIESGLKDSASEGQIKTKVELDYETKTTYTVSVTATDPSGASDSITVTINVTNENDKPVIQQNVAPAFAEDTADRSVAENSAADSDVGDPVIATDANTGDTLTYALSGDDAESFSIDASTGQITVGADTALDFESETNSYTVTVTATDRAGATDSITVNISVTDVNEAPVAAGEAAVDYAENGTDPVGTYSAPDPDAGDSVTWTLSGADAASFTISENGILSFAAAPAEEASDANGDDTNGDDANGEDANGDDANGDDANGDDANGEDANGDDANGDDANGDDANGEDANGDDANGDAANGEAVASPNFEQPRDADGDNIYEVTVTATDPDGASSAVMVSVTVTDVNEAPVLSGSASADYAENGTDPVGTYMADDPDADDTTTLTLSGDDAAAFTISEDGMVSFAASPDFEAPADSDMDNDYTVTVTATDSGEATDAIDVTVTVTNVNEAPAASGEAAVDYAENGTDPVGTYMASDPDDGDTITWALSGADAASFTISEDGMLSFAVAPDFETPGDADMDNMYMVTVAATDSGDATDSIDVTVTVTNVNEAPAASGEAAVDYAENGTDPVGTYVATDPDDGDAITWSLSGADAGSFSISEDGMLSFAAAPAEEASDEDMNGAETNGEGMDDAEANGEGMNGAEANGEGMNGAEANGEGMNGAEANGEGTDGAEANGDDANGDDANGDDANGDDANGDDANGDDANGEGMNGAEANGEGMNGAEANGEGMNGAEANGEGMNGAEANGEGMNGAEANGEGMNGAEANGEGMNGAEANGEGMNGAEANGEGMNGAEANGEGMDDAETAPSPDYEAPGDADGDNVYEVTVIATDSSGETGSIDVTVTVTDVDENNAPAFAAESADLNVAENSEAMAAVGDPVVATDADEDEVTYALSGDGAAAFEIWPSGQITVAEGTTLDFESEVTSYSVTVTATDPAGASGSIDVTINVTDVDENNAPAFGADAITFSVDENAETMAAVGDPVVATDTDEDELTYSLSGDGAAAFEIWPSGQITVAEGAALDYESDTTSYSVTVTATDPSGASDSVDVIINVNNVGLMSAYDSNDSGDIDKDEAVKAVQDYFEDTITRGEALEVLQLYFAG